LARLAAALHNAPGGYLLAHQATKLWGIDALGSTKWAVSDDTQVTVRARFSRRSQTDYSGLPPVGTVNPGSPTYARDFIFLTAGQPPTTAENHSVGFELKHQRQVTRGELLVINGLVATGEGVLFAAGSSHTA
jgi:hypothetical protein